MVVFGVGEKVALAKLLTPETNATKNTALSLDRSKLKIHRSGHSDP
jgi:hypothetical protein